jgi:hypothetical protein
LSGTDCQAGYTSTQGILTSRGWFVGRQEREAGVHNHKNSLGKKQLKTFNTNKASKIYKIEIEQESVWRLYNNCCSFAGAIYWVRGENRDWQRVYLTMQ